MYDNFKEVMEVRAGTRTIMRPKMKTQKFRLTKTIRNIGNYHLDKPIKKGGIVLFKHMAKDPSFHEVFYIGTSERDSFTVPVLALEGLLK